MQTAPDKLEVSIIIPARNEEACLGSCLESLVAQTGVPFEIIVVDDHSTDRTREIAQSFTAACPSHVRLIEADPLPAGWTGKNNAVFTGERQAQAEWLLFTDADTVHLPGSLAAALEEARKNSADLLSYSPEQIAVTFWEMAILPVVFAELARQYSPAKVSDPASPIAAANGQYILIRRNAYDAVGGHAAVAGDILEDVALARAVKTSGRKILFRYAADRVRTRMYRNFRQLREGWTKNLALLFPNQGWLAFWIFTWWVIAWITLPLGLLSVTTRYRDTAILISMLPWIFLAVRIQRAHFRFGMTLIAIAFGPPLFAYLLVRSSRAHSSHNVTWKGRTYDSDCRGRSDHSETDRGKEDRARNQIVEHAATAAKRPS
jgi:glycosyltransferase involved in cell wall biosynthesis